MAEGSLHSIVARFPQREFDVRKRCARDEHFRSICADYEEAAAAFRRWQDSDSSGKQKAADYAQFLRELEAEIIDLLDSPRPAPK